jgi:ABC-2 type transport system permease protein
MRKRIAALIRKEFRHILRDPGTLGTLLVVPLFLLVMFGYAISLDVKRVPLAVRDLDRSAASRDLAASFFASEYFSPAGAVDDRRELTAALDSGSAMAALEIPRGFAASLARGDSAAVQILVDGSDGTRAATVMGYVEGIVQRFGADLRALERSRSSRQDAGPAAPQPLDVRPRVLFNQELKSISFLVPGLVALILIISSVISTALAVVREKETGSMEQIVVSPVRPIELIVGKTLPYAAIGLGSATLVLAASALLFGIEVKGGVLALAAMTILFILACLALGILFSSIAETQQVAFLMSAMFTLIPTFILSGFVFPIRNMPAIIQAVTWLFPTKYYIEILRAILLKGADFGTYWHQALALVVYALIAALASAVRFARGRS